MPDQFTAGIEVREIPGQAQSLGRTMPTLTAFVGRTLRGPVERPVLVHSFGEYQRVFGGLWEASPLSYAVEQYFLQGGQLAGIVRVINGGQPVSIDLPAGDERLCLRARNPGAGETLRVSVDYDNIGDNETDRFNLVVQRMMTGEAQGVLDQEIYRRLSTKPDSKRYLPAKLVDSSLLRPPASMPARRPDATAVRGSASPVGYAWNRSDGSDGEPLSDYDLIGSAKEGRGLFALRQLDHFDLLCMPPPEWDRPLGPAALLAAVNYCKRRRAILLMDPAHDWEAPREVMEGVKRLGLSSEYAALYYPWLRVHDTLTDKERDVPPSGVAAGVIARCADQAGSWVAPAGPEAVLRGRAKTLWSVHDSEVLELAASGINAIGAVRRGMRGLMSARTLAGADCPNAAWRYLAQCRLTLEVLARLERDTRWVVFEANGPRLWEKVFAQIRTYLNTLYDSGAFVGDLPAEAFFVKCDAETNGLGPPDGTVNIVFGFASRKPGLFTSFEISQRVSGTVISHGRVSPYAQRI